MALDQYLEAVPQTDPLGEDKSSLEKWTSATDAIADSDRNASGCFDCYICLDSVQDPVVTLCGHLYCWPCIYKWLHFHSISSENDEVQRPECPVCKTQFSQASLVPLYGRGQTTSPTKGKSHDVGIVIPQRPHGPLWEIDSPRPSSNATAASHPSSQLYHRHHRYHPQQFHSTPGSDTTIGVFGEMIYARVFGNQVTNVYDYPNSYNLAGNNNPRIRRHLMQADRSLSRISFFLLCCVVLCLLLF